MFNFLKKVFGSKQDRDVKAYDGNIDIINDFAEQYQSLTNDELRNKTLDFRERIKDHLAAIDGEINSMQEQAATEEDIFTKEEIFAEIDKIRKERNEALEEVLLEILPEAFAVVKETARRFSNNETLTVAVTDHDRQLAVNKPYVTIEGDKAVWKNRWTAAGGDIVWNMVHYDVQLIGGMALHDGKIAEMATGEGKTLVATLPAYLNGLSGQGVHVVTVNDYLARRDSEWIGPIFEFLLLTIDCIDKHRPHSEERRKAYLCDITYGTNNEFGFDYLRDNMVHSLDEMVQIKHHFAMVDEVDSVLVDDARTPLIISGPTTADTDAAEYMALKPGIERLIEAQRKVASEQLALAKKLIEKGETGVEEGQGGLALLRVHRALPKYRPLIKYLSEDGIRVLLQKTENHYMQEQSKNMHIVDEQLYFNIDEKNRGVELTEMGAEYLAKGSGDSQFFILPDVGATVAELSKKEDMSLEEMTLAKEKVAQEYAIKSQRLHSVQQLLKAYTLFEKDTEYIVTEDKQVKIVDEQTGRVMEGRRYSDGLHQAIEAKENVKVGETTQTYATVTLQNYFRMYHKLAGMTGTAETEAGEFWQIYKLDVMVIPTNRPSVRKDSEDLVFKTAREKYNSAIDEIVKLSKAGQPILVGTTSVDISEKLSRMLHMRGLDHNVLNAKQHQREAFIVAEAGLAGKVTIATNMAGRGTDIKLGPGVIRCRTADFKGPCCQACPNRKGNNWETDKELEICGLHIIGTERHDSRRVDRQLRGRSGRQGDPGATQFYVSLEDNLMRLFQSEKIAGLMDRMGHKEGEVIQHSMVTKSIERAQKKVEENNFGIRKRLLEYDDVMNIQREAIYKKRYNALSGERLAVDLYHMFESLTENIVSVHHANKDFEGFRKESLAELGIDPDIDPVAFSTGTLDMVSDAYYEQVMNAYDRKSNRIKEHLLPVCQRVLENEGHKYKRISVPYSDGRARVLPIAADLETAVRTKGKSIMKDIEKAVSLALIDEEWKEHLRSMDDLKDSVQGASFEQKDPLVIYKMEAYHLFEQLVHKINLQVVSYLMRGQLPQMETVREAKEQKTDFSKARTSHAEVPEEARRARAAAEAVSEAPRAQTFVRQDKKIGRNDPCHCGSGKKYKNCHGAGA
jgi:preprotein translocase subunit SecA